MSQTAIGIDLGSSKMVFSKISKNGIEVILNESSARQSMTYISLLDDERLIGDSAKDKVIRNFKNSVTQVPRIVSQ
jgi:molecular chaperone DnaK (HSP70)